MFIGILLILFGIYVFLRAFIFKKQKIKSQNKYISENEKKLQDDNDYIDYIEWCELKGILPSEKEEFNPHQIKEYQMYKKLMEHGINGL